MTPIRRLLVSTVATCLVAPALGACGGGSDALVIYNAQHEELIEEVAAEFTDATGVEVEMRNGSDLELANQLVAEGDASQADVLLTENSPAMSLVQAEGLLTELPGAAQENIPEIYRAADDSWTGFAARSTVMLYNKEAVATDQLPDSLLDLAEPEWEGRVALSPTGADFQAIVAAVLELEGEDRTRSWLEGLQRNGTFYDGNSVVLEAVNAGEVDAGISYHYYWYIDQEESGAVSDDTALHYFGDQDPGAFVSVSGAGMLASGDHPEEAAEFLEFLTGEPGQQVVADSYALEYPLNPAVELRTVPPLDSLEPPDVDVSDLDSQAVVELMQETGFL